MNGRARVRNGHDCRIRYLEANEVEKIKESPTKCSENLNKDILLLVNVDASDGWNEGLWQFLRENCGWVWNKTRSIYQRPTSINRSPMKKRKIKEHKGEAKATLGVAGRDYFRCGEDAVQFILDLQKSTKMELLSKTSFYRREKEISKAPSPGSSNLITTGHSISLSNSSVVSRIGSVLGSVIDTFRSPKPRNVPVDGSSSKETSIPVDAKEVKQPQITVSSNGRVRTPSLKTVKLTPELVNLIREGSLTEEQARSVMLDNIKCNNNDKSADGDASDDGDDNDSGVLSPLGKLAKQIPWEEATKYILLDTSYGMQPWLWRLCETWAEMVGESISPWEEQSSFKI